MRYLLALFGLIITGCTSNKIVGTWIHDGESEVAAFKFDRNGNCEFTFAAKEAIDGISPDCTYKIKENIVEVMFESSPNAKEKDIMLLEKTKDKEELVSKEPNLMGHQFVFIKDKNGL